jgi:two-component system, sensor histidine kinase PdtaS
MSLLKNRVTAILEPNTLEMSRYRFLLPYLSAVGLAGGGILARVGLNPLFHDKLPYITFYPVILIAALYGGWRAGVVCLALCAIAGVYFLAPNFHFAIEQGNDFIGWGIFVVVAAMIVWLAESQRRGRQHAEATAQVLQERQQEVEHLNARQRDLLQEMHHRIKNNLQILSSMLEVQMMHYEEVLPLSEAQRLASQMKTLATIHDVLNQEVKADGLGERIAVQPVLTRLLSLLEATSPAPYSYHIGEATLSVKQATSLAMLVTELTSNAVKHGRGWVKVTFQCSHEVATLTVEDNGPGFPSNFVLGIYANTGLLLVESLVTRDLGGEVLFDDCQEGGARVCVQFPMTETPRAA